MCVFRFTCSVSHYCPQVRPPSSFAYVSHKTWAISNLLHHGFPQSCLPLISFRAVVEHKTYHWNVTGKAGLEVRGYEVSRLKDERTSRERERVPKYWC